MNQSNYPQSATVLCKMTQMVLISTYTGIQTPGGGVAQQSRGTMSTPPFFRQSDIFKNECIKRTGKNNSHFQRKDRESHICSGKFDHIFFCCHYATGAALLGQEVNFLQIGDAVPVMVREACTACNCKRELLHGAVKTLRNGNAAKAKNGGG